MILQDLILKNMLNSTGFHELPERVIACIEHKHGLGAIQSN